MNRILRLCGAVAALTVALGVGGSEGAGIDDLEAVVGLVDAKALPGAVASVPVVLNNLIDDGVIYCRFAVCVSTPAVAEFAEAANVAAGWYVSVQTEAAQGGLGPGAATNCRTRLVVEGRAKWGTKLIGRLDLVSLEFGVAPGALNDDICSLKVVEPVVRTRDRTLLAAAGSSAILVGTPDAAPIPLEEVLACVVMPDSCGKSADINEDGQVNVLDGVASLQRMDGVRRCVEDATSGVGVALTDPVYMMSNVYMYRLRVAEARGLVGLSVSLGLEPGSRVHSHTPKISGGYLITHDVPEGYRVVFATNNPVATDQVTNVVELWVVHSTRKPDACVFVDTFEAYRDVECTAVGNTKASDKNLSMAVLRDGARKPLRASAISVAVGPFRLDVLADGSRASLSICDLLGRQIEVAGATGLAARGSSFFALSPGAYTLRIREAGTVSCYQVIVPR